MEILTKTELRLRFKEILEKIADGAVFIYPTDTIYGIGCNALNKKSVQKIRQLKERLDSPLSVWVPSLDWIKKNCRTTKQSEEYLSQLPGPLTLILKLKNEKAIADNVVPNSKTIGVRLPDHWFNHVVRGLNLPIITTSANKAGNPFMTSLEDLDPEIKMRIDFMIYEGQKEGRPSRIINLVEGKIRER